MRKTIAIIPARGGSKRLKDKNIYPLLGKPLIAYTIEACLNSKAIDEVYVSSDSDKILEVSESYGAIPLKRDSEYADDHTPKVIAIRHVVDQLKTKGVDPEYVFIPQANSPQITSQMLDNAFDFLMNHNLWEVMSVDENGVQNAAIRILKMPHLYNEFLSAHCGFVKFNCLDVHTIEDIKKLEEIL